MSEQLENQDAVEQTAQPVSNPFETESWGEELPVNAEDETSVAADSTVQNESKETEEEEVFDADEYLKKNLGFDDWETAKSEIEKLRTEKTSSKYENEESEKIHKALLEGKNEEVYSFLEKQSKLNKLISSELNDKNAEDIVKLTMKSKYADLTDDEIEYKYKKQFALPKEPEQTYDETDEEFEGRKSDWEDKVKDVKMELMIEAKTSRSQLEKLKSELKLPNISQDNEQAKALTQEELASANKYVQDYLQSVESSIKSFEGFNVEYKDEEVLVQSAYLPSDEEKTTISKQMKNFAENNFNANELFADRWVKEDGTLNTVRMARDLALLNSEEKIMQKLVSDGVTKRLTEYRKSTSNIKVNGTQSKGTFNPKGNEQSQMADFFFGQ